MAIQHALQFFVAKRHFYVGKLSEDGDFDNKSTFLKMVKQLQVKECDEQDKDHHKYYHSMAGVDNHVSLYQAVSACSRL